MIENNFAYCERNLGLESDNLLNYFAGPIKISISGWDEKIELSCKKKWEWLLKDCLKTVKNAWELEDNQIKFIEDKDLSIVSINYNFKNVKLYIEHSIIFL